MTDAAQARPHRRRLGALAGLLLSAAALARAGQPDPFAANNTLYPDPSAWSHGMRPSHYAYPPTAPQPRWLAARPPGRLTTANAPAYVAAVKRFIERDLRGLVDDPLAWSPLHARWYDMPWGGQGGPLPDGSAIDPNSGREALLGSYTGQILNPDSYPSNKPSKSFQNHSVVYYNDVAAHQLGKIWRDPFHPDLKAAEFPEGSMVVKVEAATLDESDWSVLKGSSLSYVFRPPVVQPGQTPPPGAPKAVVTPMRFLQMAVRVKDTQAAPETGWVFIAFAYDAQAAGRTPWDRARPVGAMWGNDPQLARHADGRGGRALTQTWIAPDLPGFIADGLGWGGRLAGPLDLGLRHGVVTVTGQRPASLRASSCVSCHSTAQYPFVANLYPSPNMSFPPEGGQFLLFDPGSPQWAQWFQNLPGRQAMSGRHHRGIVGVDYDMMLTFALMRANGSAGTDAFIRQRAAGH